MPRTVYDETFDQQGNLVSRTQRLEPLVVAGQYQETHQVVIGGAALRLAPSSAATVIGNLPAATPVAATGQRQNGWLAVATDLGSGWLPDIALVAI